MYVAGALKNSLKSSAVGGGESMSKLYGLRTHEDDVGLSVDDNGVAMSVLYLQHKQDHHALLKAKYCPRVTRVIGTKNTRRRRGTKR